MVRPNEANGFGVSGETCFELLRYHHFSVE